MRSSTPTTHPREVLKKLGMDLPCVPRYLVLLNHVYDPDNRARTTLRQN
jgi:hypothetical protein